MVFVSFGVLIERIGKVGGEREVVGKTYDTECNDGSRND